MNPIQRLKMRDVAVKAISTCGSFRVVVGSTTNLVNECLRRSPDLKDELCAGLLNTDCTVGCAKRTEECHSALELFSTSTTFANLMVATLENEERFHLKVNSPYVSCISECMAIGECRGTLYKNSEEEAENAIPSAFDAEDLDSGEAGGFSFVPLDEDGNEIVSKSVLTVGTRIMYGHSQPVVSATVLKCRSLRQTSNMSPHATHFLQTSDGVPSAVVLLSCVKPFPTAVSSTNNSDEKSKEEQLKEFVDSPIKWCGGIVIQALAAPNEPHSKELIASRQNLFHTLWEGHPLGLTGKGDHSTLPPLTGHPQGDTVSSCAADFFTALDERQTAHGCLVRDLLELALAQEANHLATKCRLNTAPSPLFGGECPGEHSSHAEEKGGKEESPTSTASMRGGLKAPESYSPLTVDPESLSRLTLDYICRCTKAEFLRYLSSLGEEECRERRTQTPGLQWRCSVCRKEYSMEPADWETVFGAFVKPA